MPWGLARAADAQVLYASIVGNVKDNTGFEVRHVNLQLRVEGWNITNRPQFSNPGSNRSSLQLNPDGTIRGLNGYTEITSTRNNKTSERSLRVGLRVGF